MYETVYDHYKVITIQDVELLQVTTKENNGIIIFLN
jgi:hypothetical protein